MKFMFFVSSYLLAFIPAMFLSFAVAYGACTLKFLLVCFRRHRATEPAYGYGHLCALCGLLAGGCLAGLYALAGWVGYDPTFPVVLMFLFPGLTLYADLPGMVSAAEQEFDGDRSAWRKHAAEVDRKNPSPASFNFLFAPIRFRRATPASVRTRASNHRNRLPPLVGTTSGKPSEPPLL